MRRTPYIPSALVLALLPGLVFAQEEAPVVDDSGFKILAGGGVQAVDNLFASASDPVSDVINMGTLGLSLKTTYSRQQLALNAAFTANKYTVHQDWDYIGTNLSGNWQWASGTGFHGAVTAGHVVSQTPVTSNAGSTQRNLNTTDSSQVALGYELGGGWDLNSGLVYSNSHNEGTVVGQASYQYSGAYVGATYNFRSGSSLTWTVQNASGSNFYNYTIRSSELKFTTLAQDAMTLTWQLLYWNQSYDSHPEYDYAVLGGGVQTVWPITSKTTLSLSLQRQSYGNPSANSVYSVTNSAALAPAWELSSKVILRGIVQNGETRDYGDPGGGASGRIDYVQTRTVGLYWTLSEYALVSLSLGRTSRTSTVINSDFVANQVTLQGTYTF